MCFRKWAHYLTLLPILLTLFAPSLLPLPLFLVTTWVSWYVVRDLRERIPSHLMALFALACLLALNMDFNWVPSTLLKQVRRSPLMWNDNSN